MSNYNEWHSSHKADNDISAPWHLFVKDQLALHDVRNKSILEIGCGRGGFSNYLGHLIHKPGKIIASDYSTAALDIARNKYLNTAPVIEWEKQDIMQLTFPEANFDMIISCETIEHVNDPQKAIEELHRVLKPGGKLFLTCPNYFNPFGVWCFYRWIIGKPFTEGGQPYVNYILFPKVYRWLKRVGFTINLFRSTEIIIPARVPKHFWNDNPIPFLLKPFGYRTYFVLTKR